MLVEGEILFCRSATMGPTLKGSLVVNTFERELSMGWVF